MKTIFKLKRLKIRILSSTSDRPLVPIAIDAEIAYNEKSSIAIEATKERLQVSKKMLSLSLTEIIKQRM